MKRITLFFLLSIFISTVFSQSIQDSSLRPSYNTPIIRHLHYELEYSEEHEQAVWVYYTLDSINLTGPAVRKNNFKSDPKVETGSAVSKDYNKAGYDRGHLCPADSVENKLESELATWEYVKIKITRATSDSTSNSVQCKGFAKSTGERCKNSTSNPNGYCSRHQSQYSAEDTENTENTDSK